MNIHGEKLRVNYYESTEESGEEIYRDFTFENSCVLTIDKRSITGAGASRGTQYHPTLTDWKIAINVNMNSQFTNIFGMIGTSQLFTVYTDTNKFVGHGFITDIDFAGQGKSISKANIQIQGSGKLTRDDLDDEEDDEEPDEEEEEDEHDESDTDSGEEDNV